MNMYVQVCMCMAGGRNSVPKGKALGSAFMDGEVLSICRQVHTV